MSAAALPVSPLRGGVGIGSTWSAALDEQLNNIGDENTSQKVSTKDSGKENLAGSPVTKIESSKSNSQTKHAKIIFEREILSPEMVKKLSDLLSINFIFWY